MHISIGTVLQRLVHRPSSATGTLVDAAAVEHSFALAIELAPEDPRRRDGRGPRGDPLLLAEVLGEAVTFIGHDFFRIPRNRPAVFERFEVGVAGPGAWRPGGGPAQATVDLCVRADPPGTGLPSALHCRALASVAGSPCGSGRLEVSFPAPRAGTPAGPASVARGRARLVSPQAVGGCDAHTVLVGPATTAEEDALCLDLRGAGGRQGPGRTWRDTPDGDLIEASRQAAVLTAARLRGFTPGRCTVTSWSGRFDAPVDRDVPVRCVTRPRTATRNRTGQPEVPVDLRFTQHDALLGTVSVTILEDG